MNTLRLYAAVSCFFLFLSCVENEIETFDISIDIQPHGSATIEPEVYGPLFPGDSISITIAPHEGFQFDQWSGSVSSFEKTITLFGTQDYDLTASLLMFRSYLIKYRSILDLALIQTLFMPFAWAPAVV